MTTHGDLRIALDAACDLVVALIEGEGASVRASAPDLATWRALARDAKDEWEASATHLALQVGAVVAWIREQIAECEAFEHRAALNGASAHTAATQRRTLEAVLAKLEGRS